MKTDSTGLADSQPSPPRPRATPAPAAAGAREERGGRPAWRGTEAPLDDDAACLSVTPGVL